MDENIPQGTKYGACYAFSPVIVDPKGSSVLSIDIPSKRMYFFTPFNTTELNQYKTKHGTKGVDDELLKCTGYIYEYVHLVVNSTGLVNMITMPSLYTQYHHTV